MERFPSALRDEDNRIFSVPYGVPYALIRSIDGVSFRVRGCSRLELHRCDRGKRQTATAFPAEPGGLPLTLDPITEFRARGSSLVPYISSTLRVRGPGAITKVMIGPAADALADDVVRAFLRGEGLSSDIVERCDIPYTAL